MTDYYDSFHIVGSAFFRGTLVDVWWSEDYCQIAICEPSGFPQDATTKIRGGDTASEWMREINK